MGFDKIEIAGLKIDNVSYSDISEYVSESLSHKKTLITYVNANTVNLAYHNKGLENLINSFNLVHPDGIGIFLASRFLKGKNGFKTRIAGSDYYNLFIDDAIEHKWKIFFFGHDNNILNKIKLLHPGLNICGINEGYNFNDEDVIKKINSADPDFLIIGIGFPKQEQWIWKNKEKINFKVCICVGEGIRVFAGTKTRGPKLARKMGFEWLVRLFYNPRKLFKRYILGNPLFLYRIITLKFRKFRG